MMTPILPLHPFSYHFLPFILFKMIYKTLLQLRDLDACTFLVELQLNRPYPMRGSDLSEWEVCDLCIYIHHYHSVYCFPSFIREKPCLSYCSQLNSWFQPIAVLPYLDRELSPALYRSFFIPHLWHEKNVFGMYKLLKRTR